MTSLSQDSPPKPPKPFKSASLSKLPSIEKLSHGKPLLCSVGKPPLSPTHKQCLRLRLQKALSGGSLKIPPAPLTPSSESNPSCSVPPSPTTPVRFKYQSNSFDEISAHRLR